MKKSGFPTCGIRVLNDFVLIEPEPVLSYTEQMGYTHIVVPERYKYGPSDPPMWGKVVSKGPGCRDTQVPIGARVLYPKFGWAKLEVLHKRCYALVREGDLLAVCDQEYA